MSFASFAKRASSGRDQHDKTNNNNNSENMGARSSSSSSMNSRKKNDSNSYNLESWQTSQVNVNGALATKRAGEDMVGYDYLSVYARDRDPKIAICFSERGLSVEPKTSYKANPMVRRADILSFSDLMALNNDVPLSVLLQDESVTCIHHACPVNKVKKPELQGPIELSVHLPQILPQEDLDGYEQRVFNNPSTDIQEDVETHTIRFPAYRAQIDLEKLLTDQTVYPGTSHYLMPRAITASINELKAHYPFNIAVKGRAVMRSSNNNGDFAPSSSSSSSSSAADYSDEDLISWNDCNCADVQLRGTKNRPHMMNFTTNNKSGDIQSAKHGNGIYFVYTLSKDIDESTDPSVWLHINPKQVYDLLLPRHRENVVTWLAPTLTGTNKLIDCVKYDVSDDFKNNFVVWFWSQKKYEVQLKLEEEGVTREGIADFLHGTFSRSNNDADDDEDENNNGNDKNEQSEDEPVTDIISSSSSSSSKPVTYVPIMFLAYFFGQTWDRLDPNKLFMPISKDEYGRHPLVIDIQPLPPFGDLPLAHLRNSGDPRQFVNPPTMDVKIHLYYELIHEKFWNKGEWQQAMPSYNFFVDLYRKWKSNKQPGNFPCRTN